MSADNEKLVDHLFRHEAGKMVSILTRLFGIQNLELAQDVVQEAFYKALQDWRINPIPNNPSAWLLQTAKNKAIDYIRREKYHTHFAADISHLLKSEYTRGYVLNDIFTEGEIADSQLRMIFTCCHPALSPEMQIALTLQTIAGFSIHEIANALVSTKDAINKGLFRARKLIKEKDIQFEIPAGNELPVRLDHVHTVLYLLFNEGYNSSKAGELIRKDLCLEAIRLCLLLVDNKRVSTPETFALLSLMCFHAARFDARTNDNNEIILLENQDRSKWDRALLDKGLYYLTEAYKSDNISAYHIESAIIAQHCMAASFDTTDWEIIVQCYDALVHIKNTPHVHLNRAVAISKLHGPEQAIEDILHIADIDYYLKTHYLFSSVLGSLYLSTNNTELAHQYLNQAYKLTTSEAEKALIISKIALCNKSVHID